jgi:hypothetical protein
MLSLIKDLFHQKSKRKFTADGLTEDVIRLVSSLNFCYIVRDIYKLGTLVPSHILKRNSNSVCAPTKMTLHRKTPLFVDAFEQPASNNNNDNSGLSKVCKRYGR